MMGKNGFHIHIQQERSYKNIEKLFSGNFFAGQCYIISNWLHRPWPYSNQEPTAYEVDAKSTRQLDLYLSSMGSQMCSSGYSPKPSYKLKRLGNEDNLDVGRF